MLNAYIYNGIRTPFGRNAGALSKVRPDDMMGVVIKEVVGHSAFDAADIDDVNIGCGNQAGEDSRCVARHAALLAGLPIEIPGSVVNICIQHDLVPLLRFCLGFQRCQRNTQFGTASKPRHRPVTEIASQPVNVLENFQHCSSTDRVPKS